MEGKTAVRLPFAGPAASGLPIALRIAEFSGELLRCLADAGLLRGTQAHCGVCRSGLHRHCCLPLPKMHCPGTCPSRAADRYRGRRTDGLIPCWGRQRDHPDAPLPIAGQAGYTAAGKRPAPAMLGLLRGAALVSRERTCGWGRRGPAAHRGRRTDRAPQSGSVHPSVKCSRSRRKGGERRQRCEGHPRAAWCSRKKPRRVPGK